MGFMERATALDAALQLHSSQTVDLTELRHTADVLAAWLGGTTRIRITPGPITDEATSGTTNQEGTTVTQLNTGQKFSVSVDTEDASGFDTPETIEWSVDNSDVVTLNVSEDTRSVEVVSGAPGSAVLTASIPSMDPPLSATLAVDVVPAGTATIELVAGDVTDE